MDARLDYNGTGILRSSRSTSTRRAAVMTAVDPAGRDPGTW